MTLDEGHSRKRGSCHVMMTLSLKGWMERGETVRQREMENSRIDTEENVTKNPSYRRKKMQGTRIKDIFCVCLCVHVFAASSVWVYIMEWWMSGVSLVFSMVVYLDLSVIWDNERKGELGGCDEGRQWWLHTGNKMMHWWRDERRGEELGEKRESHLGRDN